LSEPGFGGLAGFCGKDGGEGQKLMPGILKLD